MEDIGYRIQEEILKRAKSYTPEWRFDTQNPDIGSALAICYAKMLAETIRQFSKVPLKNKIAFLNELDVKMLPAAPSCGYAQFTLINEEAEGIAVEQKTKVLAQDNTFPDGQALFETKEEVYVTPAVVSAVYQTCDLHDSIYELYDREKKEWKPFALFDSAHENLQKHELYFAHDTLLCIETEAYIEVAFSYCKKQLQGQLAVKALADGEKAVFEYYSEKGWTPFEMTQVSPNGLLLHKSKKQPPFAMTEMMQVQSCWIRCRLLQYMPFSKFRFDRIMLSARSKEMVPDTVFGTHGECDVHTCMPFGERLDLYDEIYFGSEEALSKKGAQIVFSYGIRFEKYPLDTNVNESFDWEWVMNRSDMKQEAEFDVTIASVVWEYFNGVGWTKLFAKDQNSRAFSVSEDENSAYRTICFLCPDTMEKVLVNARETYYIRARITKIDNLYKQNGYYYIPVLDNLSFRYQYEEGGQAAQAILAQNNLETKFMDAAIPFLQTGVEKGCMYLGFMTAPVGNPIRMLFCIDDERERQNSVFYWEYWAGSKWKILNVADETRNFSRTGLVIFEGASDMSRKSLFGKAYYWLRVRESGHTNTAWQSRENLPVLQNIFMNTTTIENVHKREREFFQMTLYQGGQAFPLLEKNIYEADVYVDEGHHLSDEELSVLKENRQVLFEKEADGLPQRIWVKWKQTADFSNSSGQDRHFVIDQSEGTLLFGNGVHGRIPYPSQTENIRIDYCTKGGDYTNLPAGKIDKTERAIGYIHQVTNPKALTGGCDAETPKQAMDRATAALRHQNRAVSANDYEKLVLGVIRDARLVKCFAGYDDTGKRAKGAVTLVVLPKQFLDGQMRFREMKDRILRSLDDKISAVVFDNHKFFVIPPKLVEIRLHIEISVVGFDRVFEVKREILARIERFLTPADSRSKEDGWHIGSFPNIMQIQNVIYDIEGITYIRNIVMSAYTAHDGGKQEIDVESARAHRFVLPVNGVHEIRIIT